MKAYRSLFKRYKDQPLDSVFAHAYPISKESTPPTVASYDEPFRLVAKNTIDGHDAWAFQQPRFQSKYPHTAVPKLRNYLDYTFARLLELEQTAPGNYFAFAREQDWITFNTGLQNPLGSDLLAIFQRYKPKADGPARTVPDWVFKGCYAPNDRQFRELFGKQIPDLAWYSTDSRDYIFDTSYTLEKDVFEHLFEPRRPPKFPQLWPLQIPPPERVAPA